uniref:Uncharacterized protein n=1 Tax=Romanomermis culicivorax TaxID=13658 RepID=A0A915HMQ6_ROMCU
IFDRQERRASAQAPACSQQALESLLGDPTNQLAYAPKFLEAMVLNWPKEPCFKCGRQNNEYTYYRLEFSGCAFRPEHGGFSG